MMNNTAKLTKMTTKTALTNCLTYIPDTDTETKEVVNRLLDQLAKKASKPKKVDETKVAADEALASKILAYVANNPNCRPKAVAEALEVTTSKVSAVVRRYLTDTIVSGYTKDGVAYDIKA